MANTYTWPGTGERWAEGNPTAEDFMNFARIGMDHLYVALNTITDSAAADGILIGSFETLLGTLTDAAAAATKVMLDTAWDPASGTAQDNQTVRWRVQMDDDAANPTVVGALDWVMTDVGNGAGASEDLRLDFLVITNGSLAAELSLTGAALYPSTDDGCALGKQNTNQWADLELASGAVIGFANHAHTITHSGTQLTFSGAHANALIVGGSSYPVHSAPSTSGINYAWYLNPAMGGGVSLNAFYVTPTFTPTGASNDTAIQIIASGAANNSGETRCLLTYGSAASGKTLAEFAGVHMYDPGGAGEITTVYGLRIDSLTKGSANYAIHTGASGAIHLGALTASQDVQTDGSSNLTTVSDMSWKNDLGLIGKAVPIVMQLRPRYWNWKRDMAESWTALEQADQPRLAGFFAQEVHSVYPEGSPGGANLDEDGEEHWGLNSTAILAVVTKAVQEHEDRLLLLEKAA